MSRDSARRTSRAAPRGCRGHLGGRGRRRAAGYPPTNRKIAEPGEELLQPQRRASSHPPGERPAGDAHRTMPPSPRPSPVGRKDSVWVSTCCQWPGIAGSSRGSREPSTEATGRANVKVSGASGATRLPAAGSATTLLRAPGTNHATWAGSESVSQDRTAAATVAVPVVARPTRGRREARRSGRLPASAAVRPITTRLTGSAKLTVTGVPRFGRSKVERMCTAGVMTVTVRFSCSPDEPRGPAGAADLDRDGQALTGREANERPNRAAAQLDRHRRSVGASHRHPLDVPREPGQ